MIRRSLYFCIWYKCEYGRTSQNTNAIILKTSTKERAKDFCKEILKDEGEDWIEYNIYCTPYNEKNKLMRIVYNEQERVAWED